MFQAVVGRRPRRIWSPATVVVSIGAHVLLGGAVLATASTPERPERPDAYHPIWIPVPQDTREAATPPPAPPAPQPDRSAHDPPGETLELPAPEAVPERIPRVDPDATPITPEMVTGLGRVGTRIGPPPPAPPPGSDAEGPYRIFVPTADMVDEPPKLANFEEVDRLLERLYPGRLRDARTRGQVVVEFVLDRDGRVIPGSARVISATHDAFAEASLRALERFRFRPARLDGETVRVRVTQPIAWIPRG